MQIIKNWHNLRVITGSRTKKYELGFGRINEKFIFSPPRRDLYKISHEGHYKIF